MKKNVYVLSNVDCASCAMKVEEAVNKLNGVENCIFNFFLLKLIVNFDENVITDEVIEKTIHKALSDIKIVSKNGSEFIDNYGGEKKFKLIQFKGRSKK